jgi:hypothetical protein
MKTYSLLVRSFLRTAVDGCILPGTMLGTEILWLYFKQWRSEWSAITLAVITLVFFHLDIPANPRSFLPQTATEHGVN